MTTLENLSGAHRHPVRDTPLLIALDVDGTIHVSRFRGSGDEGRLWTIRVDEAGLPTDSPSIMVLPPDTTTTDAEDRGRGVPNYIGAPAIRPGSRHAWLPATSATLARYHSTSPVSSTADRE